MSGAQFRECLSCAAKPGSPTLCDVCLHNRKLEWERDEARAECKRLRAYVVEVVAYIEGAKGGTGDFYKRGRALLAAKPTGAAPWQHECEPEDCPHEWGHVHGQLECTKCGSVRSVPTGQPSGCPACDDLGNDGAGPCPLHHTGEPSDA